MNSKFENIASSIILIGLLLVISFLSITSITSKKVKRKYKIYFADGTTLVVEKYIHTYYDGSYGEPSIDENGCFIGDYRRYCSFKYFEEVKN